MNIANTLVQIRVDEKLKDDAAAVYENLGLDLSTAVRIFFKRSVAENGIPFSMKLGNADRDAVKAQIPQSISARISISAQKMMRMAIRIKLSGNTRNVQVAQNEAAGVADLAVGVHQTAQDFLQALL